MGCRASSGICCPGSVPVPKVVVFGTGNVAYHMARGLYESGVNIVQIFGRNTQVAAKLAHLTEAQAISSTQELVRDADLYILAVSDSAIGPLARSLPPVEGVVVHTAGSVRLSLFEGIVGRFGVLYPLQTFSQGREVDWESIPLFLEANSEDSLQSILEVAKWLSPHLHELSSEHRLQLHLAAVFVNNFVNHCYAVGYELAESSGLNPEWLHPLMRETLEKAISLQNPFIGQTGPALRGNTEILQLHLSLLDGNPTRKEAYRALSNAISTLHKPIE